MKNNFLVDRLMNCLTNHLVKTCL